MRTARHYGGWVGGVSDADSIRDEVGAGWLETGRGETDLSWRKRFTVLGFGLKQINGDGGAVCGGGDGRGRGKSWLAAGYASS